MSQYDEMKMRMLRDSGAMLRAAIEGVMRLLLARAEMRKEFEAGERTMVAPRDNNPLKLMSDPREAMDFLFDPGERTDGLLDPVHAGRPLMIVSAPDQIGAGRANRQSAG